MRSSWEVDLAPVGNVIFSQALSVEMVQVGNVQEAQVVW